MELLHTEQSQALLAKSILDLDYWRPMRLGETVQGLFLPQTRKTV